MRSKNLYRPELQGLRAIAVLSVLFYHLNLNFFGYRLFEGGYLGVDIFFVLSGYLISRIIIYEYINKATFDLINFYERRARRILPLLLFIILFSVPFAIFRLLPNELNEYAKSILSSIYFVSNFFFSSIDSNYGATSGLSKPFLHTWSLSTEIQFYIIFPILIILILKYFSNYLLTIITIIFLLSLQFADTIQGVDQIFNFYSPFTRLWEFLIGFLLAYREINYKAKFKDYLHQILPVFGLFLITHSILFFDNETPHPSFDTLYPIFGVALIIVFTSKEDLIGKILNFKFFVWLGLISYSIYLWHFPILAFLRVRGITLSNFEKIGLIGIILILSTLSYKIVEKPLKNFLSRKMFYSILIFIIILLTLSIFYVIFSKKFNSTWNYLAPKSITTPYEIIKGSQKKHVINFKQCHFNVNENDLKYLEKIKNCSEKFDKGIFILGDSHGTNISNSFHFNESLNFVVGFTQGGCRISSCNEKFNQYKFFIENILHNLREDDIVIYHQSGSHLIKDQYGNYDSQKAFIDGIFKIDKNKIKRISDYLNTIGQQTSAKLFWLGPFVEYRYDPKIIVNLSMIKQNYNKYLSVNPISIKAFQLLDKSLKNIHDDNYTFLNFNLFYEVNHNALIKDETGHNCFQFSDNDHFSSCGEKLMSKGANFNILNLQ